MRILVTGASGSGTSTLASALALELDGAHVDADDYFWLPTEPPFTTRRDNGERLSLLLADLSAQPTALLAGSVAGWGAALEESFDLIVFIYLDTDTRIARLKKREMARFGRDASPAFILWAAQYDEGPPEGRSLAKHRAWLSTRCCPVIELHGDLSVADRVAAVMAEASNLFPSTALPARGA